MKTLVLTFNRPTKLNAWTERTREGRYLDLFDAAEDDPEVRALVVTGAGAGSVAVPTWRTCSSVG